MWMVMVQMVPNMVSYRKKVLKYITDIAGRQDFEIFPKVSEMFCFLKFKWNLESFFNGKHK